MPKKASSGQPAPRGDINSIELPGLNALGPLETRVMEVVWTRRQAVTVKDIHMALFANTGTFLAYTTVMATMSRLAEKGLLTREKDPDGQAYIYVEAKSQAQYRQELARRLIEAGAELEPTVLEEVVAERRALQNV